MLGTLDFSVSKHNSKSTEQCLLTHCGLTFYTIILVIAIAKCQRAKIFAYTRALFNLFGNVMNYRNLQKIVCTQFD